MGTYAPASSSRASSAPVRNSSVPHQPGAKASVGISTVCLAGAASSVFKPSCTVPSGAPGTAVCHAIVLLVTAAYTGNGASCMRMPVADTDNDGRGAEMLLSPLLSLELDDDESSMSVHCGVGGCWRVAIGVGGGVGVEHTKSVRVCTRRN